ncbi:hypothetical protein WJX81_003300 [Elliptochloris bilobata]|uniref:Uncharacterized protein n=1 Tax=Elliptochloris bilobata TaxID=381761 RepID=A0AAW1S9B5_9CHLO
MLKIYVARELDTDPGWVEEQLALLREMLPELLDRLELLKASLVLSLVSDTAGVAAKLVQLKGLLPLTDVPALVARHTGLLHRSPAAMAASLEALRAALGGDAARAEALVAQEPALLGADVDALLDEVRRLVPGQDPMNFLVANPGMVLSMAQAGLESAIDGNLV